jgi:hypothetical protein
LNPDIVGGITGGIINYPYFYTPNFYGIIAMLTDAQVRKIKPLKRKPNILMKKACI